MIIVKNGQKMEDYTPDASQASRVIFFNAVFVDAFDPPSLSSALMKIIISRLR